MEWPQPVHRVASFLRETGAEARLEELPEGAPTASAAADAIGCTLGTVVESVVLVCDGAAVAVLVPGDSRVDSGKVARVVGARHVVSASADEVAAVTGFPPGGVPPFPLERAAAVLVERSLLRHAVVWARAGSDRHVVALAPAELVRLTRGRVEDVVLESP